jgi:hypothetical protein
MKTHCWTCLRQASPAPLPCPACPVVFCSVACKPASEQHRSGNLISVVDPHPHRHGSAIFGKPDPHSDPHLHQIKIRICIRIHIKVIS